jgi:hypothetical protein
VPIAEEPLLDHEARGRARTRAEVGGDLLPEVPGDDGDGGDPEGLYGIEQVGQDRAAGDVEKRLRPEPRVRIEPLSATGRDDQGLGRDGGVRLSAGNGGSR